MPSITASVIAGGVAAAGSVAGAVINSSAAGSAADKAQQNANANDALLSKIYDSNKTELQPYVDRGNVAGNAESDLLGLNGPTSAASTNAFNDYLNSDGYKFQLDQGTAAITGSRAAAGTLDSGGTLKSLNAYGQGVASQYFQTYLGNLNGIANTGLAGAGALAGVGENFGAAVTANNTNATNTSINAGLSSANSINGLIANGVNAFGLFSGSSSFGGGSNNNTVPGGFMGPGQTTDVPF